MIDVKELRIGNYVFPKNDSGKESVIGEIFAINDYLVSIKGHCPKFCVNGNRIQL